MVPATKAQNEGEDMGPVKSGAGRKGSPVLLADSVSPAEQKAKGDVKKKGRLDPYAYIPLNRTKLNRRYVLGRAGSGWHGKHGDGELRTPNRGGSPSQ